MLTTGLAPLGKGLLARHDVRTMRRANRQASLTLFLHDRLTDVTISKGENVDLVARARIQGGVRLVAMAEQAITEHPNSLMAEVIERAMRRRERAHDRLADEVEA